MLGLMAPRFSDSMSAHSARAERGSVSRVLLLALASIILALATGVPVLAQSVEEQSAESDAAPETGGEPAIETDSNESKRSDAEATGERAKPKPSAGAGVKEPDGLSAHSPPEAIALFESSFSGVAAGLDELSQPAPRIETYLSKYSGLVRGEGSTVRTSGLQDDPGFAKLARRLDDETLAPTGGLVYSSTPLRTKTRDGDVGRVDNRLRRTSSGFQSVNPVVDVQYPAQLGGPDHDARR